MPRRNGERRDRRRRSIGANVAPPPEPRGQQCGCRPGFWYCPEHWAELSDAERLGHRGNFGGRGGAR